MKKAFYTTLSALLVVSFLTVLNFDSKACIDPDTTITVDVNCDSTFTQAELRLGNLKLHTEAPNTFCSCALSSYEAIFDNVTYVAFVVPGTNTPYNNFAEWDADALASTAWDNQAAGYPDWNGFIGEVNNAGLGFNDPVELVVRAVLPPGYSFSYVDSSLNVSYFGTDMWDPTGDTIAADHMGLRYLGQWSSDVTSRNININVPDAYFTALDQEIMNFFMTSSIANPIDESSLNLNVSPNPFNKNLQIEYSLATEGETTVKLYNMLGNEIEVLFAGNQSIGTHSLDLEVTESLYDGVYILVIESEDGIASRKVIKQ